MHDLVSPSLRTSRSLTQQDYRTLGLASLGGTLEFYDFIVFVFFAAVISDVFFRPLFRSGYDFFKLLVFLLRVIWLGHWAVL